MLEAPNARAALQMIEAHPDIAALFTRCRASRRNERTPARRRGAQGATQSLKVLFTTGYARNAIVHEGRLDPGVELLTKPFSQAALGEKLRDIIDAKSTPARVFSSKTNR